ncbi:MAG TPA: ArsR family transcriptional regulator [Thermoanaerobaculia bacterium]|nr:ArsR family transcriptional regulator [Thermoanaerobaculia bacterium]
MAEAPRIDPERARRLLAEDDALLVCAYDDHQKCQGLRIDGSISFPELKQRLDGISKDRSLIFYCA